VYDFILVLADQLGLKLTKDFKKF